MDLTGQILAYAQKSDPFSVRELFEHFKKGYTRVYLSQVVNRLVKRGDLVRSGSTRSAMYASQQKRGLLSTHLKKRFKNENIEEYRIYQIFEKELPFIRDLPEHLQSILVYAFTEMMNNAIEHSQSDFIEVEMGKSSGSIFFTINDFGVGVFKNVMKKRKLNSELEAIQDLLKGKTTTAPRAHSGEGIFFTSKAGDVFSLESFKQTLMVDNHIQDLAIAESERSKTGTLVSFFLDENHTGHLDEVFREYYTDKTDFAFDKTKVLVKLYTMGTIYVSRSQARRLLSGLDKFKTVVLDFDQVPGVGQAFCDEIFRVFQKAHPEIAFETLNTNEHVRFMVERAKNMLE